MEKSHSSVVVHLHPLVALQISDQWTRKKMNNKEAQPRVFGFITGKHEGLKVEVLRSHMLLVDEKIDQTLNFDEEFFETQHSMAKEMFPAEDVLGWYVTSNASSSENWQVQLNHQFIKLKYNEYPIILKFDADKLQTTGHLGLELLETVIDPNDETKTFFRKLQMHFETEASELIALEHMATFSSSGDYFHTSSSKLCTSLLTSMEVFQNRLVVCKEYVKSVLSGEIQKDDKIISGIFKLCLRLKALQSHTTGGQSKGNSLATSSKQIASVAGITALYEDLQAVNELLSGMMPDRRHTPSVHF